MRKIDITIGRIARVDGKKGSNPIGIGGESFTK